MQVIESTYVVALRDYPEEVPAKERIAAEARYAKILEKQLGGPEQVAADFDTILQRLANAGTRHEQRLAASSTAHE